MKKIVEIIKKNKKFLITAHINLEGDALGSCLAVYGLLKRLKKKAVIYLNDPVPDTYKFLPFHDKIKNTLNGEKFDVALVLDCSDASRTGKVKDYLTNAKTIVNIDHHISNTYFGDLNWVNPRASSACEMVFALCKKSNIINNNIAQCIYTGMFTDTGNFTYANTTANVHKTVAALMKFNIHPEKIYEKLHSCCSPADMKFMGKILSSVKVDLECRLCWIVMKKWHDDGLDLTEIIFSVMKLLKNVDVFVLFKKVSSKKVRVNFRSRSRVDVNRVARFFAGGGHKKASGTTVEDTLESTEKKVISYIKRYTNGKSKRRK